ncbi:MAG: septum formation initiator family protein [Limisphaerales bacterium]
MNVDLGIWSKLTKVVVGLVVIAVLLLIGMCYLPVIQANERMRSQIMVLQDKIKEQEAISRQLQADVDAMKYDTNTIIRRTREKLPYARPDETVIRFEPVLTNAAGR